jgi:hypothetical protein
MKIHSLFFCFFIFFTCDWPLKAFSHDDIILCAENICELLLHGGLRDDCTIEKYVTYMSPDVPDKQYTREPVINVIVNNEEMEKFYAQKNFWSTIKNGIFVLKSLVALAIVLVILYLLYRGYEEFFEWPPDKPYPSSQLQEGGDVAMPTDIQGHGGMDQRDNGGMTQKQQEQEQEQEKNQSINSQKSERLNHVGTQESGAGNQPSQDAMLQKQQEKKQQNQKTSSSSGQKTSPNSWLDLHTTSMQFIFYWLRSGMKKEIDHAKSIGLVSSGIQADTLFEGKTLDEIMKYGRFITQQLRYAKRIGLEPSVDCAVHFRVSR